MGLFQEFERTAKRSPRKTAIVAKNTCLTYAQLADRVKDFSGTLVKKGVRAGDAVGILLPNGCEFATALLAAWKIAAVAVPLHMKFEKQEIARYIADCKVNILLREGPGHSITCVLTNTKGRRASGAKTDLPALIQYSTGSTGLSKRVTRTHRQLLMEFRSVSEAVGIGEKDRILGVAPFFHSYGFVNAFLCGLFSGATLFTAGDFFTRDIVELIEREKITGFPGVPFMHQLLADFDGPADLSSLRYALSAGAPLPEPTAKAFLDRFKIALRSLYGTTETGVISIGREKDRDASASVGLPIAGVTVEILDDSGRKVPPGTDGNIAIKSAFAAKSYDGPAKKGESRFAGEAFFPGDLGRLGKDGRLALSGRKRTFINVAGNKVDPAEVEAALKEHPAVTDAAVIGAPDKATGESVKAFLVTSSACTKLDILKHCRERLAEYKRPRIIEFREEIKKNSLGKVLRKYL